MCPTVQKVRELKALETLATKVEEIHAAVTGERVDPADVAELMTDPKIGTIADDTAKILAGQVEAIASSKATVEALMAIARRLDSLEANSTATETTKPGKGK